jgi:hypothetical protein
MRRCRYPKCHCSSQQAARYHPPGVTLERPPFLALTISWFPPDSHHPPPLAGVVPFYIESLGASHPQHFFGWDDQLFAITSDGVE